MKREVKRASGRETRTTILWMRSDQQNGHSADAKKNEAGDRNKTQPNSWWPISGPSVAVVFSSPLRFLRCSNRVALDSMSTSQWEGDRLINIGRDRKKQRRRRV